MSRDRVADFFRERTPKRAVSLFVFVGLLVLFRKLFVTLTFFVVFERLLFFSAGELERRFKWRRTGAFAAVAVSFVTAAGLLLWGSSGRIGRVVVETRETLPARIALLREHPLFELLKPHLPDSEDLVAKATHYGAEMARSAAELGHLLVGFMIGLVLAIVYYFDQDKVRSFRDSVEPTSLTGTCVRWLEHVAEALSLTVQLQLIVALANAALTLPVLLVLGVPHVPALMLLIFVSGLIPVVGNLVSGVVLSLVAYQTKGWLGVGLFVGLTFVLHKLESYYLNPRLTSRHVKLPGFVLILSLVAWEHLLGIAGLFVSFPFLFVAGKILAEFRAEESAGASGLPRPLPLGTGGQDERTAT
jgi:predicted PurR-regulated permease PerM